MFGTVSREGDRAGALRAAASIEVTPRTLARAGDLAAILPPGRVVFIAHIAGTPIDDMVAAARVLRRAGFEPKPHVPARLLRDRGELAEWLARYRGEAGVTRALLLAGGVARPAGGFSSAMDLAGTGLFDAEGFEDLSFAGHPEGNRDIDPKGGTAEVDAALRWKQAFAGRTDARISLVTQFVFDPAPVLGWIERIGAAGIDLPVHVGLAGPAKLQTLIRFGLSCGVGPSIKVLQKRVGDIGRLLRPITPDPIHAAVSAAPSRAIAGVHLFPLGGIGAACDWIRG